MIPAPYVLVGQLLGTAFACGLNLYLTLAVLGIAGRAGWVQLPTGMGALENGIVIGMACVLFLVEFIVDRQPMAGNAWEGVHTVIRPATAGLLAAVTLQDASPYTVTVGALAAGAVALAAHGSKAGIRLMVATRRARKNRPAPTRGDRLHTLTSLGEDLLAAALVTVALFAPAAAPVLLAAALALLAVAGPRIWRAALLGLRALIGRFRGFFGRRGWRAREGLPRVVRNAVPPEPLGRSPARGIRAAVNGLPRIGSYRNGWLVFTCDGPVFVYRSMFRSRIATLPPISRVTVRRGLMTDALDVEAEAATNGRAARPRVFTIFLLKDGPPSDVPAAELTGDKP